MEWRNKMAIVKCSYKCEYVINDPHTHITGIKTGTDMKIKFLLFKENNFSEPYKSLHLWINVAES